MGFIGKKFFSWHIGIPKNFLSCMSVTRSFLTRRLHYTLYKSYPIKRAEPPSSPLVLLLFREVVEREETQTEMGPQCCILHARKCLYHPPTSHLSLLTYLLTFSVIQFLGSRGERERERDRRWEMSLLTYLSSS